MCVLCINQHQDKAEILVQAQPWKPLFNLKPDAPSEARICQKILSHALSMRPFLANLGLDLGTLEVNWTFQSDPSNPVV